MEVTSRDSKMSARALLVSTLSTCVPAIELHFSGLDFLTRKKMYESLFLYLTEFM